jgi:hypothetical protein
MSVTESFTRRQSSELQYLERDECIKGGGGVYHRGSNSRAKYQIFSSYSSTARVVVESGD